MVWKVPIRRATIPPVKSPDPQAAAAHNANRAVRNVAEEIKKLKEGDGPELQVHGSADFIQTLLENDLVDEFWLKIFPVTLGMGKRLFDHGTISAAYTLVDSKTSPSGVIVATLKRAGELKTGSF